ARSWSRQTSGNDCAFRILANPATLNLSFGKPLARFSFCCSQSWLVGVQDSLLFHARRGHKNA
ncbi:MAG: hypothetical protein ABGZ35_10200, partial [Planctomycetaceae bacterium]